MRIVLETNPHAKKKQIESTWAGREVGGRAVNEGGQTRESDEDEQEQSLRSSQ
jgi:hypothetical protein